MRLTKPTPNEYAAFYADYIDRVSGDWFASQEQTHVEFRALLAPLSEAQAEARPGPDEWTIKEVIGHIADGERLFAYRALRIGRNDPTPLSSFNPTLTTPAGEFSVRPLADLLQEFDAVRAATLALFRGFPASALLRMGTVSGAAISVRALAYIIAGHEHHHLESLRRDYLHVD